MNETQVTVPSWAAVATIVAIVAQLITLAAALSSLIRSQRDAGRWTGSVDEMLRGIRQTLNHLVHEGDDLRERVARHSERLAQQETRIEHLEYHEVQRQQGNE